MGWTGEARGAPPLLAAGDKKRNRTKLVELKKYTIHLILRLFVTHQQLFKKLFKS